ncbi:MAG: hypothetical protein ABID87_05095 [Chloroflexota bacterium]
MGGKHWTIFGLFITISLALAGLGFAAMSTNPPFSMPEWVPSTFFVTAGIMFVLSIVYLFYVSISNKGVDEVKTNSETRNAILKMDKKEQANKIHDKLMTKEKEFWVALEKVPDKDAVENAEVKKAVYNMRYETNRLANLIGRDDFDEFIEALLNIYNRYAMFHFKSGDHSVEMMRNRMTRKIRMYIRKIK